MKKKSLSLAITAVLLIGCAPQAVNREEAAEAVEGYIEDADKLHVVDCLLPGQLRKLGSQATYLSGRRPIRTTEADCEVRGGEYVAYDRANYATALKVWLPKAEEGDATAQLYVGQIYEKGLGRPVDYSAAAKWYRKAADQGNAQAQLNLGALYEKGLGVAKDAAAADHWYRKASGLESAGLQFAAAVSVPSPELTAQPQDTAARRELETLRQTAERNRREAEDLRSQLKAARQQDADGLRQAAERSRREAEALRAELNATRQQLLDQQDDLRQSQNDLEKLREQLAQQKTSAPAADDPKVRELEAALRQKESLLKAQQARVDKMATSFDRERRKMQKELAAAKERKIPAAPVQGASAESASPQAATAREQLGEAENALNAKMDAYRKSSAELTALLTGQKQPGGAASREEIDRRKAELQTQAREISALKEKAERLSAKAQEQGSPEQIAQNGPSIEIIEPPVTLTRGARVIQIGPNAKDIVGKIQSPGDLKSLSVNDRPLSPDASGIFRFPATAQGLSTAVKITAIDKRNKTTHLDLSLVAATATEAAASTPEAGTDRVERRGDIHFGKFYALIIGNNSYNAYPALQTPANDAKSLDVVLRERYGFSTRLLLNATRHQIMTALNEIHKKLTPEDNLLIYYAGHGEIDKSTQMAYWLPTDAEAGNPANWISSQSITEFISIMPARHVMVVADSCYSGALTGSAVAKLPDGMDAGKREKWLKVMASRKARTVLTSGGVQPVMDQGGGGHSVFANAFLGVLRGNQRILEDYDVFRSVAGQVKTSASKAGFEQAPHYAPLQHAGHEGSPFFFVPESV
jgi:TPR repeat protein